MNTDREMLENINSVLSNFERIPVHAEIFRLNHDLRDHLRDAPCTKSLEEENQLLKMAIREAMAKFPEDTDEVSYHILDKAINPPDNRPTSKMLADVYFSSCGNIGQRLAVVGDFIIDEVRIAYSEWLKISEPKSTFDAVLEVWAYKYDEEKEKPHKILREALHPPSHRPPLRELVQIYDSKTSVTTGIAAVATCLLAAFKNEFLDLKGCDDVAFHIIYDRINTLIAEYTKEGSE